jgi:hypothetical protein
VTAPASFTALDWIAVGLVALLSLALLAFPFVVAPPLAAMYSNLVASDSGAKLPAVTRVALSPWAGPAMSLLVIAPAIVAAARPSSTLGARRAVVVGAFFLGALALVAMIYAMYAPIWDLADKIKAE